MKRRMLLTIPLSIAVASVFAQAKPELKVATGGPADKSTYTKMFDEIAQLCGGDMTLTGVRTSGSIENLSQLTTNKVNGAFVQSDVLWLMSQNTNMTGIKTLLALHPEEVHVVAPVVSQRKTESAWGKLGNILPDRVSGSQSVQINDLAGLAGMNVAAAGGSVDTATAIKLLTLIPFEVVRASTNDEAVAMMKEGKVDAVIGVGGAPLGWIEALGSNYKLVPIFDLQKEKLKQLYTPTTVNYPGLNSTGIPTVYTEALFVTREYKTPRFVQALSKLRSCVYTNIDELKETIGFHAKWQTVDVNNKGKLPWYELPAAQ